MLSYALPAAWHHPPRSPAGPHWWHPHNNTVRSALQYSRHVPGYCLQHHPPHKYREYPAFPEDTGQLLHIRHRLRIFSRKHLLCSDHPPRSDTGHGNNIRINNAYLLVVTGILRIRLWPPESSAPSPSVSHRSRRLYKYSPE